MPPSCWTTNARPPPTPRPAPAFRSEPYREPALAGPSYPADEKSLWRLLQDYLEEAGEIEPLAVDWSRPVGLLSPHIDYRPRRRGLCPDLEACGAGGA